LADRDESGTSAFHFKFVYKIIWISWGLIMADLDTLGTPEMTDTAKGKGAKSSNAGSGMG
jgi:hypothetical protein